jgi:hypothetical protein
MERFGVKVKMGRWWRLLRPDEAGPPDSRGRLSPRGLWWSAGEQQIPPGSLRSRVGMTRGEEVGHPELQGLWGGMDFEGSTFVGIGRLLGWVISLTSLGAGEMILI